MIAPAEQAHPVKSSAREYGYFDTHAESYAEEIMAIQPVFYENTAKLINSAIRCSASVLDIGNGGVVNYAFSHLERLVCGDLTVSQRAARKYEQFENISFVEADILKLHGYSDGEFDTVIVSAVIHHLAVSTLSETHETVDRAIKECLRVLKPGGRLLIIESTVNRAFEIAERLLYPVMQAFFKAVKFDTVYQYSARSLLKKLSALGLVVEHARIDVGPYIWIMGKKLPTFLMPCGAVWVVMEKHGE